LKHVRLFTALHCTTTYAAVAVLASVPLPEARADADTFASGNIALARASVLAVGARLGNAVPFIVRLEARCALAMGT